MATAHPQFRKVQLWLAIVFVVTAAGFIVLANAVSDSRWIVDFDRAVTRALAESAPMLARRMVGWVTWLGTDVALGGAAVIVGLVLIVRREYIIAAWWLVSQVGAGAVTLTLKAMVGRYRPEFSYANEIAAGWSFPSGHAVRTAVFCVFGAYIVYRLAQSRRAVVAVAIAATIWSLLMAFTRVYLGAHHASDVVGGVMVGVSWSALCAMALELGLWRSDARHRSGGGSPSSP